jgi:hypothetical protein
VSQLSLKAAPLLENFEEREGRRQHRDTIGVRAGLSFPAQGAVHTRHRTERRRMPALRARSRLKRLPQPRADGHLTAPRLPSSPFLLRWMRPHLKLQFLHPHPCECAAQRPVRIQSRAGCLCKGPYGQRIPRHHLPSLHWKALSVHSSRSTRSCDRRAIILSWFASPRGGGL